MTDMRKDNCQSAKYKWQSRNSGGPLLRLAEREGGRTSTWHRESSSRQERCELSYREVRANIDMHHLLAQIFHPHVSFCPLSGLKTEAPNVRRIKDTLMISLHSETGTCKVFLSISPQPNYSHQYCDLCFSKLSALRCDDAFSSKLEGFSCCALGRDSGVAAAQERGIKTVIFLFCFHETCRAGSGLAQNVRHGRILWHE